MENQTKAALPLNRISEDIFYDKRMILEPLGIETEPVVWKISKVERASSNGILMLTFAQDLYDEHKDSSARTIQTD